MKQSRSEVYDNADVASCIRAMEDAGWIVYLITPYPSTKETIVTYTREV